MEEAFRLDRQMGKAPWRFSWQKNERNLVFDDHLKVELVKGFAAKELGLSAEVSVNHAASAVPAYCTEFINLMSCELANVAP